jgi:hypothetical protein
MTNKFSNSFLDQYNKLVHEAQRLLFKEAAENTLESCLELGLEVESYKEEVQVEAPAWGGFFTPKTIRSTVVLRSGDCKITIESVGR